MVLRTGLRRPAPTSRSGDGEGDEGRWSWRAWEGLCGCIHVRRYAVKMELG